MTGKTHLRDLVHRWYVCSDLAFKLMNNQEVIEGGITRQFFHPYMQVFVMFVGESVWLLVYLLSKKDHQVPLE